jgi:hypothetical protein
VAAAPEQPWRLLGNVLVNRGSLSEEDLEAALIQQAVAGGRLGEILVARGVIPHSTLSLALAEQFGIDPSVEKGFGTGLRVLLQAAPKPTFVPEPVAAPVVELAAPEPSTTVGHLVFVQHEGGYELIERDGHPPACDSHLELEDFPGAVFVVTTSGPSPLPRDTRSCVFAQRTSL